MASSLRTKLRIAASVLFATGFFDAVAGRFLWEPRAKKALAEREPEGGSRSNGTLADLAGAVHVHSTYSDGAGDVPAVMEAAREAGVDFVLLTDHNTQRPLRDGWEERYADGDPFLLIGTEVTVEHGAFLLALDMPAEWEPIKHETPQTSIDRVNERGGLALVSLPFDVKHPWRDWGAGGYEGLEVVNLSTLARRHINLLSLLWLLPIYRFAGPVAALRAILTRPDQAMARWDDLTRGGARTMVGLGALDAHALMKIGRKKYPIPSYADSFRATTTHVQVPAEDVAAGAGLERRRRAVYSALREGRCYIAYDCLARPAGFAFFAEHAGRCAPMGGRLPLDPAAPLQFRAEVAEVSGDGDVLLRLLRDGEVIAAQTGGRLEHTEERPVAGAYRIEAYRYAAKVGPLVLGARPWLFGNPVYLSG